MMALGFELGFGLGFGLGLGLGLGLGFGLRLGFGFGLGLRRDTEGGRDRAGAIDDTGDGAKRARVAADGGVLGEVGRDGRGDDVVGAAHEDAHDTLVGGGRGGEGEGWSEGEGWGEGWGWG
jgi:hypothetical protein